MLKVSDENTTPRRRGNVLGVVVDDVGEETGDGGRVAALALLRPLEQQVRPVPVARLLLVRHLLQRRRHRAQQPSLQMHKHDVGCKSRLFKAQNMHKCRTRELGPLLTTFPEMYKRKVSVGFQWFRSQEVENKTVNSTVIVMWAYK